METSALATKEVVAEGPSPAAIVEKINDLPTIPLVAHKIGELVADPRSDAQSIAKALRSDQSLTAKVLRLANSSYYAIPGGVTEVSRAVSFLGFNTLYQLVLSMSVLQSLGNKQAGGALDPRELWRHSVACAVFSEVVARHLKLNEPETYFTGGLLHDVGKVALLKVAPEALDKAVAAARSKGLTLREACFQEGLPDHEIIGAKLAEKWRFPMALRVAISHHRYTQPLYRQGLATNLGVHVDITALANALVRRYAIGDPGDSATPELDQEVLERLNLTKNTLDLMRDEFMKAVEKSKMILEIVMG